MFYGAIFGSITGTTYDKNNVTNCSVTGDISIIHNAKDNYRQQLNIGHMIGRTNKGYINSVENCYATGNLSVTYNNDNIIIYAGGLIGYNDAFDINKDVSAVNVNVLSKSDRGFESEIKAGSLIGCSRDKVRNSSASGNVSVSGTFISRSYVGGLIGEAVLYKEPIINCYATGNVYSYAAGTYTIMRSCAGGLIGNQVNGLIENSYATGDVKGEGLGCGVNTGGLVGLSTGNLKNCFAQGKVWGKVGGDKYQRYVAVGGLIGGGNRGCSQVADCYAKNTVTIGGYVSDETYAGGIIGSSWGEITLSNTYHEGKVTVLEGPDREILQGGLAGRILFPYITFGPGCYYQNNQVTAVGDGKVKGSAQKVDEPSIDSTPNTGDSSGSSTDANDEDQAVDEAEETIQEEVMEEEVIIEIPNKEASAGSFNLKEDAWPIQNSATSFGYKASGKDYIIPIERYVSVFGDAFKPLYKVMDKTWEGNCFGMTVTAALHSMGKLDLPGVTTLAEDGYDEIKNVSWLSIFTGEKEPRLKKQSELARIIEQYQIYGDWAQDEYGDAEEIYIEEIFDTWDLVMPLLVSIYWEDRNTYVGHALLTDTSRGVTSLGNGNYRIYLYDPNLPYFQNDENVKLPGYYSMATEKYIDINIKNGDWKTSVATRGGLSEKTIGRKDTKLINDNIAALTLYSFDDLDFPTKFDGTVQIDKYKMNKTSCAISSNNMFIKDSSGEVCFEISDGNIITLSEKIQFRPILGYAVKMSDDGEELLEPDKIRGMITMPSNDYVISMEDESRAILMGNDKMNAVISDGAIDLEINKANDTIEISPQEDVNITWVHQNIYSNDDYTAVTFEGEMESGEKVISAYSKDSEINVDSTSNNVFDVNIDDGQKEHIIYDISLESLDGRAVTDVIDSHYNDQQDASDNSNNSGTSDTVDTNDTSDISNEDEGKEATNDIHFTDVSGWAEPYIYYLAERGIINGKTATTFAPDDNIIRAEFVAILARMSRDAIQTPQTTFQDVDPSSWYAGYVTWAANNGIAMGSQGKFRPNDPITRQDMAVMIERYVKNVVKYTLPTVNEKITFKDDLLISDYARDAVYSMQQAGIINGKGNNLFAPKDRATRAESAKMIAVLLQEMEK